MKSNVIMDQDTFVTNLLYDLVSDPDVKNCHVMKTKKGRIILKTSDNKIHEFKASLKEDGSYEFVKIETSLKIINGGKNE